MVYVFNICIAIICYCIVLAIAASKPSNGLSRVLYHLRHICASPIRMIPVVALLLTIATLFISCGGNPDDHTGENWLLLIGLLLCWLKG